MKQYRYKKKLGGALGTIIGTAGGAAIGQPELGATVGGAIGSQFDKPKTTRAATVPTTSSFGYAKGGKLKKYPMGGELPIGPDAGLYTGPSHEQGGIPVDPQGHPTSRNQATAEVEGGETRQGDYIFSDELIVPGTEMTFSEVHQMLVQEGDQEAIQELMELQEEVRMESEGGMEQPMMEEGGELSKNPITPTRQDSLNLHNLSLQKIREGRAYDVFDYLTDEERKKLGQRDLKHVRSGDAWRNWQNYKKGKVLEGDLFLFERPYNEASRDTTHIRNNIAPESILFGPEGRDIPIYPKPAPKREETTNVRGRLLNNEDAMPRMGRGGRQPYRQATHQFQNQPYNQHINRNIPNTTPNTNYTPNINQNRPIPSASQRINNIQYDINTARSRGMQRYDDAMRRFNNAVADDAIARSNTTQPTSRTQRMARSARNMFSPMRGSAGSRVRGFLGKAGLVGTALTGSALIVDGLEALLSNKTPEQESVIVNAVKSNPELLNKLESGDTQVIKELENIVQTTSNEYQGPNAPYTDPRSNFDFFNPTGNTDMPDGFNESVQDPSIDVVETDNIEQVDEVSATPQESSGLNTQTSVVDYMKSIGMDSSRESRRQLAQQLGITDYDFSATKNLELMAKLRRLEEIKNSEERFERQGREISNVEAREVENELPQMRDGGLQKGMRPLRDTQFIQTESKPNLERIKSAGKPVSLPKGERPDYLSIAQRYLPSVVQTGAALFSPKPKKTARMQAPTITPNTSRFRAARADINTMARTARNPLTQANVLRERSNLAASESEYLTNIDNQNRQAQFQTDGMNRDIDARNEDNRARDIAGRVNMLTTAAQRPLDMARMDQSIKDRNVASLFKNAAIMDEGSRNTYLRQALKGLGYSDVEIEEILASRKYGGKLIKK